MKRQSRRASHRVRYHEGQGGGRGAGTIRGKRDRGRGCRSRDKIIKTTLFYSSTSRRWWKGNYYSRDEYTVSGGRGHRKRRSEKKSRQGEENWIQWVQPVGDEGKERKNDVDRTKAACEEGKLNTTRSVVRGRIYDRLNEIELTAGRKNSVGNWRTSVTNGGKKKYKRKRKSEWNGWKYADRHCGRIQRKTGSRDIRAMVRTLGNYFTTNDKNSKNEENREKMVGNG